MKKLSALRSDAKYYFAAAVIAAPIAYGAVTTAVAIKHSVEKH